MGHYLGLFYEPIDAGDEGAEGGGTAGASDVLFGRGHHQILYSTTAPQMRTVPTTMYLQKLRKMESRAALAWGLVEFMRGGGAIHNGWVFAPFDNFFLPPQVFFFSRQ